MSWLLFLVSPALGMTGEGPDGLGLGLGVGVEAAVGRSPQLVGSVRLRLNPSFSVEPGVGLVLGDDTDVERVNTTSAVLTDTTTTDETGLAVSLRTRYTPGSARHGRPVFSLGVSYQGTTEDGTLIAAEQSTDGESTGDPVTTVLHSSSSSAGVEAGVGIERWLAARMAISADLFSPILVWTNYTWSSTQYGELEPLVEIDHSTMDWRVQPGVRMMVHLFW